MPLFKAPFQLDRVNSSTPHLALEAQQRYFSYRAILVAIVSQNLFMLVFMGYRTIIARYVAKWGIAQMCLCQTKYQEEVSHHFGGVLTSLKIGRGRGTVGKCAGPKWSKMVKTTILVKMTLFRTGFWYSRDQNGPNGSILVHFGLKRSILVHLGPPTVLWSLLRKGIARYGVSQR